MIIIMPPKHGSWDIDSHYKWALSASSFGKTYISQADFDFYILNGETYYGEISIAHIPAGGGLCFGMYTKAGIYNVYADSVLDVET